MSTDLLCRIEEKEFRHPGEGRGELQESNGEAETSEWEKLEQLEVRRRVRM